MTIEPGSRIGPYEIRESLGAGGMGEVYRARDPKLGREIAIKILPPRSSANEQRMHKLEDEARAASSLNHPNIVTIYEIGYSDATPYISMELVEGKTLRHLIMEAALPVRRCLDLSAQVAEGLAAAHARGLVHRDLKPENIMVTRDSLAKILDFGLATRSLESEVDGDQATMEFSTSHKTGAGAVVGTAAYMSPEQAAGNSIDFRSDQFSLGLILYEMLAGRHPFHRPTAVDTMSAIMHDEAESVGRVNAKVPAPLQWIVDRCLAKDPEERYASTRDLARDLRTVRDRLSESISGNAPMVPPTEKRWIFAAALSAVVVLAAGAGLLFTRKVRPDLPAHKSIAVLPFEDLSQSNAANRPFIDGLGEFVSARLSKVEGIQVVPPSSTARLAASTGDTRKIANDVGANLVLRGAVQRSNDEIRVTYSLINPSDNIQLAGDAISGPSSDLFSIQDRLAESVAGALQMKAPLPPSPRHGLESAASQEHYLQAIGYLQRYDNEASVDGAIQRLREIQKREGDSALTLAALGRAFLFKYKLTHQSNWAVEAAAACQKATAIDPRLPDVHLTMGELMTLKGETGAAIDAFKKALIVNPSSADAAIGLADALAAARKTKEAEQTYLRAIALRPAYWSGYNKLGAFYLKNGDPGNAEKMFQKVVQLTPDNLRGYNNLGAIHLEAGRFDEAIRLYSQSIAVRPNSPAYSNLGTLYYFQGRFRESSSSLEKAVALTPEDALVWSNLGDAYRRTPGAESKAVATYATAIRLSEEDLRISPRKAAVQIVLANSYAKSGDRVRAREAIQRALSLEPNNGVAMVHAAMIHNMDEETAEALQLLKKAVASGYSRAHLSRDPEFANLRERKEFVLLTAPQTSPSPSTSTQ